MNLTKAMTTVAGLTGLSRVAGFIRDILMASILGAGPVADAFFVALKLPNFFRRVTAEGAFSVSFVPLYSEALEKSDDDKAGEFAGNVLSIMFAGLSVFSAVIMLAMPWVVIAIAPGFSDDPVRHALATDMARVTFPYLLLMSMTALLGAVLNAHDRFAPFAVAPVLFNLTLIAFLLCWTLGFETPGHALAWGVLVSGFLQLSLLWVSVKRSGIRIRFQRPRFSQKVKKLFVLMGPGVIGAGVMHINLFADMIIASLLPTGSISYLYYADRLNQLPLGVVGIAVGTALLPMLSRAIAAGNDKEAGALFNRALEICFLFALPAAMGLFIASYPIIAALFEHGAFDTRDAKMTALVVMAYAVGMPAYIAVKVYATAFWARQDTMTPVKISVVCTLFNIGLSLLLIYQAGAGVLGIAIATALAGWLQIILLAVTLKGRDDIRFDPQLRRNIVKIILSCLIMAVYLYQVKSMTQGLHQGSDVTNLSQITALGIIVGGGMIVYALAVIVTGVIKPAEMKKYFMKDRTI